MENYDEKISVSDLIKFIGNRSGAFGDRLDNKNEGASEIPPKYNPIQTGICVHNMINKYLQNYSDEQNINFAERSNCLSELRGEHSHHFDQYQNLVNRLKNFLKDKINKNIQIIPEYEIQTIFNYNNKKYLINGKIDLLIKYSIGNEIIYEILDFKICKKSEFNLFKYTRQLKVYKGILKRQLYNVNPNNIKLYIFYSYHKKKIIPVDSNFNDCYIKFFLNKWNPACDCHYKNGNTLQPKIINLKNYKKS